jgi:sortase A
MKGFAPFTKLALLASLSVTLWYWSSAATIEAKAYLAPVLIARAWEESREYQVNVKPWPWADTWPVARLQVPGQKIDLIILAGIHGATLPFSPGHMSSTALPGQGGVTVIAGHRDTHFRFLSDLAISEKIILEGRDKQSTTYVVGAKTIIDTRKVESYLEPESRELILVTCEPDSMFTTQGPYRLVVSAQRLTRKVNL